MVFAFRHSTPAQVGAQSVASPLTLRVAQARLLARKGPVLPVVGHLKLGASELPPAPQGMEFQAGWFSVAQAFHLMNSLCPIIP